MPRLWHAMRLSCYMRGTRPASAAVLSLPGLRGFLIVIYAQCTGVRNRWRLPLLPNRRGAALPTPAAWARAPHEAAWIKWCQVDTCGLAIEDEFRHREPRSRSPENPPAVVTR